MNQPHPSAAPRSGSLMLTLVGLCGGLALGFIAHRWPRPEITALISMVAPCGRLWSNALQMAIIPLVVSQLVCAITSLTGSKAVGRLGGVTLAVFVALLVTSSLFGMLVGPPLAAFFRVDPAEVAALRASAANMAPPAANPASGASLADNIVALVPANPLRAAADGAMLPLIIFSVLFGLAMTRIAGEQRQVLLQPLAAMGAAALTLTQWTLRAMPIGVFALAAPMAARTGGVAFGALGYFIVIDSLAMFGFTLFLYLPAWLIGAGDFRAFTRALAPAQAIAAGSRSSLASLPAMIAGADRWLGLSHTSFVLPLAVAVLKVTQPVHQLTKLLFMAHLYGVELRPADVVIFTVMVSVISFGIAGLPGTGAVKSIPVYLAAGIPLEGILVFNAIDAIPDIFRTMGNVTGDMTALTIVARLASPENNHAKTLDQPLHDVG